MVGRRKCHMKCTNPKPTKKATEEKITVPVIVGQSEEKLFRYR